MKKGFTLIELLVVVLIIGILAAIALPQYTTAVEKARASEALALMGTLRYAGERYRLQMAKWPGANFDQLDIEAPNFSSTNGYALTKNYKISGSGEGTGSSDNWTLTAVRVVSGTAGAATGDLGYTLQTVVKTDGTATRSCTPAANKICKAISSGKTTDF